MPRTYRKTKKSFVKVSNNNNHPNKSKTRKVPCNCDKCKGILVDSRIKKSHELKKNIRPRGIIENTDLNQDSTNDPSLDESVDLPDRLDSMEVDDNDQMMIESNQPSQRKTYTFLPKKLPKDKPKGKQKDIGSGGITYPIVVIEQNISDYDDDGDADGDNSESVDDELNFTEENPNESSSSGFDAPETDDIYDDIEVPIVDFNESFNWIVLWILLYQERHKLSNVTTDSLVKFFRYILVLLDANTYKSFPTSLYMACKILGVCVHIIKYAACEKCCKLYNIAEVSTTTPTQVPIKSHCTYIDLPNHPMANQRNECMTKLTKTVHTINGEPSLIFPIVSLKHQLQLMYNRKGFKSSCRK
ncbi:unnamed protein product [Rhizophagus irregularis]|nr:unnamed protein product [Rhizophagus irregularis]